MNRQALWQGGNILIDLSESGVTGSQAFHYVSYRASIVVVTREGNSSIYLLGSGVHFQDACRY